MSTVRTRSTGSRPNGAELLAWRAPGLAAADPLSPPAAHQPSGRGAPTLLAIEAYTRRLLRHVQPIIVANPAPLSLQRADPIRRTPEKLVRGAGGLVTAMSSLAVATD